MKLVLYKADWCENCTVMDDLLNTVLKDFKGVKYEQRDIEQPENVQHLLDHGVRNIPTLVVLNPRNEMVDKVVGVMEEFQIRNLLNDCVS